MSYADDFTANSAFDPDDYYAEHEYRARMGEWVTKDGKKLKIKDMETSHIHNCIRLINKTGDEALFEYLPVFEKELERRRTNGIQ